MITQLGDDPFGDKIVEEFQNCGIQCDYVRRTDKANTSLAFVALRKYGQPGIFFLPQTGCGYADGSEGRGCSMVSGCLCTSFLFGFIGRISDERSSTERPLTVPEEQAA